ncbi:MAG: hypothetical protein KC729_01620, partial [Candidatus Eisenbacteria bacterium]|nr:hypothetical protein [Candidatus Eisenbacteria bacterium]
DLSIGGFDGGATGWNVAFRIEGQSDWHSSYALPIDGGSTVHVTLRVQTDGELWLGQGELVVESENSGEHRAVMVEVFNASPAILAIDDDQNGTYETDLVGAITAGGYLYKTFTVGPYNDSDGPDLATMNQYDGVIWQTGFTPRTLTDNDLAALSSYLDMGRKLYLQSMDYLTYDGTKPFTSTYLGVSTYTNDARADAAVGVPGDPITDGMNFPALQWPAPAYNKADVVEPLPSAHAILHKETGQPIALRNELSNGARIAFNTVLLRALGNGPDPSNRTQFVGRTLDWLFTRGPADVPETTVGSAEWGMLSASPNPFTTSAAGTELRFSLSESASQKPVSLTVVDASGRQVRHLQDGNSGPSPRSVRWDGRDDAGRLLSSGVYWAVLRSTDGTSTVKLTHVE